MLYRLHCGLGQGRTGNLWVLANARGATINSHRKSVFTFTSVTRMSPIRRMDWYFERTGQPCKVAMGIKYKCTPLCECHLEHQT
ncbi:hypothetical protein XELAEV_18009432mg [Xenopus laevis]|uniref:Uncharacterized protein n=1 Tax=Xenopus laevis TaxID=8355 RepID=A0A974I0J6_XENLA|nr:hypothetical protein XELAEV_18009432mg [Xenopus laevis]